MNQLELLQQVSNEAKQKVESAQSTAQLDDAETEYLGRKGKLTLMLRSISELSPEERPIFGSRVNQAKNEILAQIEARRSQLASSEAAKKLQEEAIDVTLPGRFYKLGRPHVLARTMEEIKRIFTGMGFEFVDSPEVEYYKYNFEALNYPEEHPAMDEQMSFYITDDILLRTQTTAVQARVMKDRKPPLRIATLGKCYRYDAVDATHSHTFHQVDCFAVDENIHMSDLKGTIQQFCREMYGPHITMRFRPDFFPFVEPGAEVAMSLGGDRWLELGGAGMIHPNVLEYCGIDPEKYTGFAFGLGIDRMPMIKYGIDDLRLFLENDIRFLRQV